MKKDVLYYIGQGMKKVNDKFNKKQVQQSQTDVQQQERSEEAAQPQIPDYTSWVAQVRDGIVKKLPAIVRKASDYPDRNLLIYVSDGGLLEQACARSFDNYINDWIGLKSDYLMNSVVLHPGTPPAGLLTADVDAWVSIAVERKAVTPPAQQGTEQPAVTCPEMKAVITVLSGCCALSGGSVELAGSQDVKTWNIGFGEFNDFGGRKVRMNQIALQYANPEGHEKDLYPVSRAHAHINYKPGKGFIFYADPRGARTRTAVQKGEKVQKVTNTMVDVILEDNDIIILNREMLLFKLQ